MQKWNVSILIIFKIPFQTEFKSQPSEKQAIRFD